MPRTKAFQMWMYGSSSTQTCTLANPCSDNNPTRIHNQILLQNRRRGRDVIINNGVGGYTLNGDLLPGQAAAITATNAQKLPGYKYIISAWCGSNDIANLSRTPAQVYADLKTYIAAWKAAGYLVITGTFISWVSSYTNLQSLNTLIRDGHASLDLGSDALFDSGILSQFDGVDDPLNTYWYHTDTVHAVPRGTSVQADLIYAAACTAIGETP